MFTQGDSPAGKSSLYAGAPRGFNSPLDGPTQGGNGTMRDGDLEKHSPGFGQAWAWKQLIPHYPSDSTMEEGSG